MGDLSMWGGMWQAAFAIATGFVLLGLGWPLVRFLDRGQTLHDAERAGIAFLLGAFAVYFGVFLIGTWWLNPYGMGALALGLTAAAVPGWLSLPWVRAGRFIAAEARLARCRPLSALLWLTYIGVALSGLVQGLAPPNDYDSLMYQLSLPQYDVEVGRRAHAWAFGATTAKTLFPEMMGHFSRLALVLAGDGSAQMIHGLFAIMASGGAAALARRAGATGNTPLLAALLFIACRVVVWEMGSVEVDVPLTAFTVFATVTYLAWRTSNSANLMAVFGLMIGGAILTKYHGLVVAAAFVPLFIWDLVKLHTGFRVRAFGQLAVGGLIALAAVSPHLVRNWLQTGNPLFPLFNHIFNSGLPDLYAGGAAHYGHGRALLDLLVSPVLISVMPMHFYDGMVLGTPYFLALAPLVLLRADRGRKLAPLWTCTATYFVLWFYTQAHQVRFLLPIVPMFAAAAAMGADALWTAAKGTPSLRTLTVAALLPMAVAQSAFVGIYAMLRIPPAIGLVSAADYHAKTPTLTGARYATCMFVRERLKPGEHYYSDLQPHSYYCPQATVLWRYFEDEAKWWITSRTPPKMAFDEFLKRAEALDLRFFIVATGYENRRNNLGKPIRESYDVATMSRFGPQLAAAFTALEPVMEESFSAVYDGSAVINWLKENRARVPAD